MSAVLAPPPKQFVWPRPVPELAGDRYTPEEMYDLDHPQRFGGRRLFLLGGKSGSKVRQTCRTMA